jgi:hypothetical protein
VKFEQDWAVPLAICVIAALAGLVTWLASTPHPGHCHPVLASTAGRTHTALECGPP